MYDFFSDLGCLRARRDWRRCADSGDPVASDRITREETDADRIPYLLTGGAGYTSVAGYTDTKKTAAL